MLFYVFFWKRKNVIGVLINLTKKWDIQEVVFKAKLNCRAWFDGAGILAGTMISTNAAAATGALSGEITKIADLDLKKRHETYSEALLDKKSHDQ